MTSGPPAATTTARACTGVGSTSTSITSPTRTAWTVACGTDLGAAAGGSGAQAVHQVLPSAVEVQHALAHGTLQLADGGIRAHVVERVGVGGHAGHRPEHRGGVFGQPEGRDPGAHRLVGVGGGVEARESPQDRPEADLAPHAEQARARQAWRPTPARAGRRRRGARSRGRSGAGRGRRRPAPATPPRPARRGRARGGPGSGGSRRARRWRPGRPVGALRAPPLGPRPGRRCRRRPARPVPLPPRPRRRSRP